MNKYRHLAKSGNQKRRELLARTRGSAYSCIGKASFATPHHAESRAGQIVSEGGPKLRPYVCDICLKVHLTSKPSRS